MIEHNLVRGGGVLPDTHGNLRYIFRRWACVALGILVGHRCIRAFPSASLVVSLFSKAFTDMDLQLQL